MITQFIQGFRAYFEANRFISKHRLWAYVLLPGIINLLLFTGIVIFSWQFSSKMIAYLSDLLGIETLNEGWLRTLLAFVSMFLIRITLIILYLLIYKNIVLILFSPVMSLLAEKCLQKMGYDVPDFSFQIFFKNILRAIRIALGNIIKELILIILLSLLSSVFILNLFLPLILWVVSSYFYGYSMFDYVSEIKGISIKEGNRYVWRNKAAAIAIGGGFYFLLTLPIIGLLIAPTYGVVAGVLYMNKDYIETN